MTYILAFPHEMKKHRVRKQGALLMPRNSPYPITLTGSEKTALERMARKYTSSYFQVVRSKVILMAAQGLRNDQIAARLSLPRQIVSKWRKRFFEARLPGLEDLPRAGRPPGFSP
ncbi:MAG TPA: helix-turn-helix domain-containing protein [Verrucomicrobiales bacterium]|nr:helix-turn-helix domain-containing protein [Verrucomicrobiales bacterium]